MPEIHLDTVLMHHKHLTCSELARSVIDQAYQHCLASCDPCMLRAHALSLKRVRLGAKHLSILLRCTGLCLSAAMMLGAAAAAAVHILRQFCVLTPSDSRLAFKCPALVLVWRSALMLPAHLTGNCPQDWHSPWSSACCPHMRPRVYYAPAMLRLQNQAH